MGETELVAMVSSICVEFKTSASYFEILYGHANWVSRISRNSSALNFRSNTITCWPQRRWIRGILFINPLLILNNLGLFGFICERKESHSCSLWLTSKVFSEFSWQLYLIFAAESWQYRSKVATDCSAVSCFNRTVHNYTCDVTSDPPSW